MGGWKLLKKLTILLFSALFVFPLHGYAATYNFVYDFDKSLRSRDFKFGPSPNGITLTFQSSVCRRNQKMTVEIKHNVNNRPDTTIRKVTISECGATLRNIGYQNNIPVYFIVTKHKKDGFWVQGTGTIKN